MLRRARRTGWVLLTTLLATHGCSDAGSDRDALDAGGPTASFDASGSIEASHASAWEAAVPDSGSPPAFEASVMDSASTLARDSGTPDTGADAALVDAQGNVDAHSDASFVDTSVAADAETEAGPKTPYPGGRWSPPAPSYGVVKQAGIQIAMSDGVVLIGDVTYPTDLKTGQRSSEKFPVLLSQNPYNVALGGVPVVTPFSGDYFVQRGYIFAQVDVRGTGRSQGVHDMFAPREAEDGAALVMWAAGLEGSDGRVGLQGCSQLGINQLETVTQLGPDSPVKAMIPACGSGDFYRDTAFDNGVPTLVASALDIWADAVKGGDKAYYRDYWRARDRIARAPAMARADIPMLFWSGWHEPGALGSLELYTALQNLAAGRPQSAKIEDGQEVSGKYQVILGDWGHAGGLDSAIELQWFDTWIKDIDTGLPKDTKTPLHLAELGGTKRWVNASSYPLVASYTPFYLGSARVLSGSRPTTSGEDELTWSDGLFIDSIDYTSEPFAQGAMLAGPLAAHLHVTSSNANAQLVLEVLDKAPDGSLLPISTGSVLGSLRGTDATRSWSDTNGLPMRPHLALDKDEPLTPNQPTQLEVPLWPSVWSIAPGHRLVLRIRTRVPAADCLGLLSVPRGCSYTDPMKQSLAGGAYKLHRGGALGSLIALPLLERGALPTARSAEAPTRSTPLPVGW
jgi:predicted acyl esterase